MLLTLCISFSTEDWLPGSLPVLSREHWCHNADNQSDSKGQSFYLANWLIVQLLFYHPKSFLSNGPIHSFLCQDLSSPNQYDTGVALTGLSCFVTPDLARDLANDIMTLVSHIDTVNVFFFFNLVIFYISSHPITIFNHYLPQIFAVKGVISFILCHRCPTLNPTSERKQYWSCTRCFWSTQSPCALLSPGSKRNWRTQTQVWLK